MTVTAVNGSTATEPTLVGQTIDGRLVVADEPAETGLSTPERPVHFKQIRRLRFADGTTAFRCVHCEFVRPSWAQVRPHLSKHTTPKPPVVVDTSVADMRIGDLLDLASRVDIQRRHIDRLMDDVAQWKARAVKAEKSLETLRKALNP